MDFNLSNHSKNELLYGLQLFYVLFYDAEKYNCNQYQQDTNHGYGKKMFCCILKT